MIGAAIPAWEPQPDVWLLVAALATGYWIAMVRLGPQHRATSPSGSTRQYVAFAAGVLALWIAADWPVHGIAEQRLLSVHMVQHFLLTMVVPPLLLLGTPSWLFRLIVRPGTRTFALLRWSARFLPALVIFNVTLVFSHIPQVVNTSIQNGLVHFSVHVVLFTSSLVIWLPVVSPIPEIPRFSPLIRCVYLFTWSILPTIPASFLTWGATPVYSAYASLPRMWGLSPIEDQQIAGIVMKTGTGLLLWSLIAVIFIRWAADEERQTSHTNRLRARPGPVIAADGRPS